MTLMTYIVRETVLSRFSWLLQISCSQHDAMIFSGGGWFEGEIEKGMWNYCSDIITGMLVNAADEEFVICSRKDAKLTYLMDYKL
jgi:hypothetical protein